MRRIGKDLRSLDHINPTSNITPHTSIKKRRNKLKNLQEAQNEANKCLNCKVPMCQKGCPISTHIPEFIEKIKNNNLEEAYKILQSNNIMSNVCSNVCPYEECCVGHCVKGIKGEPIQVNKLEK